MLTFAYWRSVMNAVFDLIAEMGQTITLLYDKLCASDAHIVELDTRNVDLEAQNRTLVEQLKMKDAQC